MRKFPWFFFLTLLPVVVLAEPLRIMTYNVWVGFDKKRTLEAGKAWIASQGVDVLALQELKGISPGLLEASAAEWGHDNVRMFKRPGGWPQGLTSGYPIEHVEEVVPEVGKGLRGTLYCQTAGIHFFVVHFDPHNFHKRQVEAKAVVERIAPLLKAGKAVIVLGDFNAHSAVDAEGLEKQTELLERWRIKEREKPGYHAFDNNGEVDYSVMQMFLEAGLVDPAENPPGTFPTRILSPDDDEEGHAAKVHRIDFILVDPGTARRVVKMSFPRDAALDTISDHYPVLLELAPQPE